MKYHVVDNLLLTEASSDDVTDSTHSLIPNNNVIEVVDHLSYTSVDYMRCCNISRCVL